VPKIRGVKPDYWTDEDITDLTIPARLLFIGMWNHACDNGHLQDKSKQIKMRVLPADDVNVAELLRELEGKGRIRRSNGWITVPNFAKHQKPDKRFFVVCDAPGCVKPGENSQPETRGGHVEPTSSPRGGHMSERENLTGPHGDVEVRVNGSDGEGDGETSRGLTPVEAPREDVTRLCIHLANRIEANGAKRPTIGKGWHDAARLMLDNDGRTEQEIHGAIDWCQTDEFWRANVLSMPKLREKYDQLRMQAQRRQGGTARQQAEEAMWERAYARADARGGVE
jgi:hypothetical protein